MSSAWKAKLLALIDGVESQLPAEAPERTRSILDQFRSRVRSTRGRRFQRHLEHDIKHCFRAHPILNSAHNDHLIAEMEEIIEQARDCVDMIGSLLDRD